MPGCCICINGSGDAYGTAISKTSGRNVVACAPLPIIAASWRRRRISKSAAPLSVSTKRTDRDFWTGPMPLVDTPAPAGLHERVLPTLPARILSSGMGIRRRGLLPRNSHRLSMQLDAQQHWRQNHITTTEHARLTTAPAHRRSGASAHAPQAIMRPVS